MNFIFDNCRLKTTSCFKRIISTANHYICSNAIISGQFGGENSDSNESLPEPIPSPAKIDEDFNLFLENLDLPELKCRSLKNLPQEKKWQILKERNNHEMVNVKSAETYVSLLNNEIRANCDQMVSSVMVSTLEALHISLRTQTISYAENFIECGGLECLSNLLEILWQKAFHDSSIVLILNTIKSLLNTKVGRKAILQNDKLMCTLATLAGISMGKSKTLTLHILGGLCLVDDGREKVLNSFTNAQSVLLENTRFQRIVWQLTEKCHPEKFDLSVKTATMSFINVLLNSGEAKNKLEERLRLRNNFLNLGLEKIVEWLRNYEHPILQDHLDLFEMMRLEDEQEFSSSLNESQFDSNKPSSVLEFLEKRLKINDENFNSFMSILQNLKLIPVEKRSRNVWKLCSMFIEQVVSENNKEWSTDNSNETSIHLQLALQKIHTETEYQKLLEDYNQVIKRLNECETILQDKNVDSDNKTVPPTCIQIVENSANIATTTAQNLFNSETLIVAPKLAIVHPLTNAIPSTPPTPPPLPGKLFKPDSTKSLMKPSGTLKGLNWITLPQNQLEGTFWSEIKNDEIRKVLDIQLLDKNFSLQTKSKRDSLAENGGQMVLLGKSLSLLEPRRAQNCHILLSKLKMSNDEIRHMIMTLDPGNIVHKDMIEQMLKFIPTKEEVNKLHEIEEDSNLNQVDQFFLLISRIPRYEQRLKCLWLNKVFKEKSSEIKLQAEAVIKGSKILHGSKRIRKLMQLILEIGNHMNEGRHNGSAYAFHIVSLVNLFDVKSNTKPDYTLMHYLVECCELKFVEVFRLKRELLATNEAAKVSTNEIESEMSVIQNGINLVEMELLQKSLHSDNHFASTMTGFLKDSKMVLLELQTVLCEMNYIYKLCLKSFAVNCSNRPMNSGEFFSIFSKFLNSFLNIRKNMKLEKENQDRRLETLSKIRLKQSISHETISNHWIKNNDTMIKSNYKMNGKKEFEALISALQTGEVFFDDLNRLRTSFRRVPPRNRKNCKTFDRTEMESRER